MTGFLLILRQTLDSVDCSYPIVPDESAEAFTRQPFEDKVKFVGWGSTIGDIYLSIIPKRSVLILHGYVSDAPFLGQTLDQQKVCEGIHKHVSPQEPVSSFQMILEKANGSFSLVYTNLLTGDVVIGVDRLMSRPVWYGKSGTAFGVASNPLALAQVLRIREFDLGSLASFLLYGCQVDPSFSLFSGIRALNEGTIIAFTNGKETKRQRWYRFEYRPDRNLSYWGWCDVAVRRLLEAADRHLKCSPNPVVFLSGGLDSRLTAAALRAAGGSPTLITLSDSENLELRIARRVADAFSLPHVTIVRNQYWYLDTIYRAAFETGGCYVWTHGHFSRAFRSLQHSHNHVSAFLGFGCEAFSKLLVETKKRKTYLWDPAEFARNFDHIISNPYRPRNRVSTLALLGENAREESEKQLLTRIETRYSDIAQRITNPAMAASQFVDWEAVPTHPTFFNVLDVRSAGKERSLMFDTTVHDLLGIMPVEIRDQKNLGAQIIRRLAPRAARVPNANTLLPVSSPSWLQHFAQAMRPRLGRIRRLFENSYKTTASWPLLDLLYVNDNRWREIFTTYLVENAQRFDPAVFDTDAIRNRWNSFYGGELRFSRDVERLLEIGILRQLLLQRECVSLSPISRTANGPH